MTPAADKENQQLRLPDGRGLGFAEYGRVDGVPVFYFHGWPSSRLEARAADRVATALGVRLVAPERPGYGLSDLQPGRKILDWPADVSALADHLRLRNFAVLGVSGGGPYAAACALRIPDRLASVSLVSSVAPPDAPGVLDDMVPLTRWLLDFARTAPWLAEKTATICLQAIWGKGDQVIPRQIEERLPPADKQALENPDFRAALKASSREALRHGVGAAACDGLLLSRPWGLSLAEITIPVRLWHGEKDIVAPPAMGRYLAQSIPDCRATFCPEEGHFSLPCARVRDIIQAAAFEPSIPLR